MVSLSASASTDDLQHSGRAPFRIIYVDDYKRYSNESKDWRVEASSKAPASFVEIQALDPYMMLYRLSSSRISCCLVAESLGRVYGYRRYD